MMNFETGVGIEPTFNREMRSGFTVDKPLYQPRQRLLAFSLCVGLDCLSRCGFQTACNIMKHLSLCG